jgi:acyl carrier protein
MQPCDRNHRHLVSQPDNDDNVKPTEPNAVTLSTLRHWFINRLADAVGMAPCDIDSRDACTAYGIDSIAGVSLVGDLEMWLNIQLPPTLLWHHDSIEAVCQYVMTTLRHVTNVPALCRLPSAHIADNAFDLSATPPSMTQLDSLTDTDVDALLHRLLAA